tara:strand:- start:2552 stop:3040 length:489 start_codon:yes stop_codon:yes gene_type:complete
MTSTQSSVYIQEYSAKSFVVRGDTQPHKEALKNLGGKWGNSFTDKESGEKFGAWLFWTAKKPELEKWISNGMVITEKSSSPKKEKVTSTESNDMRERINRIETMLIDIVEVMESLDIDDIEKLKNTDFYKWYAKQNESKFSTDDTFDEEEEETKPRKRLLKK